MPKYQSGSVVLDPRSGVYSFRWRGADGKRRAERIGKCKSKSEAIRKSEGMRLGVNDPDVLPPITLEQVAQRFILERVPPCHSSTRGYKVKPRAICRDLGTRPMPLKPFEAEQWLKTVKTLEGNPCAPKTKTHYKSLLSMLHDAAMFWPYIPAERNPISLFKIRGGSKPVKPRVILTVEQFGALRSEITKDGEPYPTLTFVDACSGLRESELLGLR